MTRRELEALTLSLPDLDQATRELYSDRKRHKVLSLFLHELAHTLGAIHRSAKVRSCTPSTMPPSWYDGASLALLRVGLAIRLDGANRYREAREYLEKNRDGFVESERAERVLLLAKLEPSLPQPASGSPRRSWRFPKLRRG